MRSTRESSRRVGSWRASRVSAWPVLPSLIVIQEATPHLERSARNLPGVGVIRAEGLNVHDVLRHEKLVIVQAALDGIHGRLGAGGEAQA